MDEIVVASGGELEFLLRYLTMITETQDRIYRLEFAVDGGIKIRVNEHTFSPPFGLVEKK